MTLNRKRGIDAFPEEPEAPVRRGSNRAVPQAVLLTLFLAAATVLFVVLAARTMGFRELAAAKIEGWTQTAVGIRGSHAAWPFDVVLTGVTVPAKREKDKPGLSIPEIRAGWRVGRGLVVRLVKPSVRLVQTAPGAFEPDDLALIGDVRNAGDVSNWLEPLKRRASMRIDDGALEIVTPAGEPLRRLEHIALEAVPVSLPEKPATYFRLRAGPMTGSDGRYREFKQEWLADGENSAIEIAFGVDAGGKGWGRDFWKGTSP